MTGVIDPDWISGAHQKNSVSRFLAEQGINNKTKGSWVKTKAGGGHSAVTVRSKTGTTLGNYLFPIKLKLVNEK